MIDLDISTKKPSTQPTKTGEEQPDEKTYTLLEKQKQVRESMASHETESRFTRDPKLTGQQNFYQSPIPAHENEEEDETVTRDELEQEMQAFERDWTTN